MFSGLYKLSVPVILNHDSDDITFPHTTLSSHCLLKKKYFLFIVK